MRELIEDLKEIKLAIFDLDGVIYRGTSLIPNSDHVIRDLKENSVKLVYNTNNSTATRQMYVDRLKNFNIKSELKDIFTSASITAGEITDLKKKAKIFVIGEIGLKEELELKGHTIVNLNTDNTDVDYVIVGMDRDFNYKKLAYAQNCILQGNAQFFATNSDSTFPIADRLLPGAGVMVNALQTCTNQPPVKIFGKPSPFGINAILKITNGEPNKSVIFGDRLNTDILAGNRAGIKTVLVLTGVTTKKDIHNLQEEFAKSPEFDKNLKPDLIINSLDEIFAK